MAWREGKKRKGCGTKGRKGVQHGGKECGSEERLKKGKRHSVNPGSRLLADLLVVSGELPLGTGANTLPSSGGF